MGKADFIKGINKGIRLMVSAKKRLANGKTVNIDTGSNFEFRCSLHYRLSKIRDINNLKTLERIIDIYLREEETNRSRT